MKRKYLQLLLLQLLLISLLLSSFSLQSQDCYFTNLTVEALPCDNGEYYIQVDFESQNTGDQFNVYGPYGESFLLDYGSGPYLVGPLYTPQNNPPSSNGVTINDFNDPTCNNYVPLDKVYCGIFDCQIYNVEAIPVCDNSNNFHLELSFDHQNTTQNFNVVYEFGPGNITILGTFPYGQDMYSIYHGLLNSLNPFDQINLIICDADPTFEPTCYNNISVIAPDCNSGGPNCQISNIEVIPYPCDALGSFFVDLTFDHQQTSNTFQVLGNGQNYGTFSYGQSFYQVFIPAGNPNSTYEFIIQDTNNPGCSNFTTFEHDCDAIPEACEISNFTISPGQCNNDGTYPVTIDFDVDNPLNTYFKIYYQGEQIGNIYGHLNLPVTVNLLNANDNIEQELEVCIREFGPTQTCCATTTFDAPCTLSDICGISNVVAEAHECDADGNFFVDITFDYQNTGSSFNIGNYGPFEYGQAVYTIGPIDWDPDQEDYSFLVSDNDHLCANYNLTSLEVNCFPNGFCNIDDLSILPGDCNAIGTYPITINFEYEDPSNDSFDVIYQNESIGFYPLSDLPVTIASFLGNGNGNGNSVEEIQICIKDNPDCCESIIFDSPCVSSNDCQISNVFAEAHECDAAGNFFVDIEFDYQSTSNTFYILANGTNYGTFAYGQTFYTFGPVSGQAPLYEFTIIDSNVDDCNNYTTLLTNCNNNETCNINDLNIVPGDCNSIGTYPITIDFEYENPTDESFDVIYQNDVIGFYSLSDLPVTIPSFLGNANDLQEINICINDNPDCCATTTFNSPCGSSNDCQISNVFAEAHECDPGGNFLVDITFDYQNTSNTFEIVGNGNNYGTFEYGQTFYTIGPIEWQPNLIYEFIINDSSIPDCGAFTEIEVDCNNSNETCNINDLNIVPGDCNAIGTYPITIDFEYENPTDESFDVIYQNDVIGFYSLSDLPVTIPSFLGNGNDVQEIKICINDNSNCCATTTFNSPCGSSNDCQISNVFAEAHECDAAGNFLVDITFDYQNTSNTFEIVGNGNNYGTFEYGQTSYTIGPIEWQPNLLYEFIVNDSSIPDCGAFTEINGDCPSITNINVWPGDANFDNIANHFDLLNIGVAYGTTGEARTDQTTTWSAWYADNWTDDFLDGTNFKNADCNGDGIVNSLDVTAIAGNYHESHGPLTPFVGNEGTVNDPPLFVDLPPASELQNGAPFTAPIILGTEAIPVIAIYGIAFTIEFNPDEIQMPATIEINSSWLGGNNELIKIDDSDAPSGKIEVAISRMDQQNVGGSGPIADFVGIIDDILGRETMEVQITNIRAIQADETPVALHAPVEVVNLNLTDVNTPQILEQLDIFPNPSSDILHIRYRGTVTPSDIQVYNILGQEMLHNQPVTAFEKIEVSDWSTGIYLVKVVIDNQPVTKKIKVERM